MDHFQMATCLNKLCMIVLLKYIQIPSDISFGIYLNGEWMTELCAVIIWGDNLTGEEKPFSSWIYTKKNNMMLLFALSYNWHDVILFLCLMCKLFHISSKIDPVYPIITLSHHPHFVLVVKNEL